MAEVIYNAFIKTDRSLKIIYASPFAKESMFEKHRNNYNKKGYRTSFR